MNKEEFLVAIEKPFRQAFTKANCIRAFEVTGTWPVDRSKISNVKTAPSEGLSIHPRPLVEDSSPVRAVTKLVEAVIALPPVAEPGSEDEVGSPLQKGHNSSPTVLHDLQAHLLSTRASFLVNGSIPSSSEQLPPFAFTPITPFKPTATSQYLSIPDEGTRRSRESLIADNAALRKDNQKLTKRCDDLERELNRLRAQYALTSSHLKRTQTGLHHKEGRQVSAKNKGILLKGGGILTSKDIMDKIKARDDEKKAKEEAKMRRSQARIEKGVEKVAAEERKAVVKKQGDEAFKSEMKKWQEDKVAWQEDGGQVKDFRPQPRIRAFMKAWMEENVIGDELVTIPKRSRPRTQQNTHFEEETEEECITEWEDCSSSGSEDA